MTLMQKLTGVTNITEERLLNTIQFPKQEVLKNPEHIKHRKSEAERAKKLGNSFNDKVYIIFEDTEGKKMVESIVWGVTDRYLMLKRGMSLPIHRVHEIIINKVKK
jgi:hypothetical protein